MNFYRQIVALTFDHANLLWDNEINDFVSFAKEVKNTDSEDVRIAIEKAKELSNIELVFDEMIDTDTQKIIDTNVIYNRLTDEA